MKFKVNAGALAKELARAMGAVEKKTTIPILGNVMLAAKDGRLRIETTDLEISYLGGVDAEVAESGSVTIPARKLADYVGKLHDEATLSFNLGDNLRAMLSCEKSKAQIAGQAAGAWPEMPTPMREIATVPAWVLVGAFSRTAFAITDVQVMHVVPGAMVQIKDGVLICGASDGKRLAWTEYRVETDAKWKAVIPRRAVAELSRAFEDGTDVAIAEDDNHLFFSFGDRRIVSRMLSVNFPRYESSARIKHQRSVDIGGAELAAAVSRVVGFADEQSRRVDVTFGPRISVATMLDDGAGEEEINGACDGDPVTIGLVAPQIIQAIKSCGDGRIRIAFKGHSDPVLFTPVEEREGETCINVLSPLRKVA